MTEQAEYSILDQPEVLSFIFFPRKDVTKAPANARDYLIPIDSEVSISCRFYVYSQRAPSFIYFHGNGEVVSD